MKLIKLLVLLSLFSLTACSHKIMVIKHSCKDTKAEDIAECDQFKP